MTQLTEHFSLEEMTRSEWAQKHRVRNIPNLTQIAALQHLCITVLEPLRRQFGPIRINSGFRCERVNAGVHGVGNSRHLYGEAADIHVPDRATARRYFLFIRDHCNVDQLIFEYNSAGARWLHVSTRLDEIDNRHQYIFNLPAV